MASTDLLSIQSRIEVPFISLTMAGHTFGVYKKFQKSSNAGLNYGKTLVEYPNFVKSLNIVRSANGTVNVYTIELVYAVTEHDDPNFLENIFSKASKDRKVILSYGDYNAPSYIYREEQALIQKISPSFNFSASTINYTITAVSSIQNKAAGLYNFPAHSAKPSDVIKNLLYSTQYKLTDVFFGMLQKSKVLSMGLIPDDDKVVNIQAKESLTILSYLSYLVDCMANVTEDSGSTIKGSVYRLAFFDDITNELGGPYFKIVKQTSNTSYRGLDLITFDLGFPGQSSVIDFRADVSEIWSILYNTNEEMQQSQVQYYIDDKGVVGTEYYNRLAYDGTSHRTSEDKKTWLSKMTSFPINATMTIKGLLKPAILTTNIRVNVLFYGKSYILSGVYMIIGQTDTIDQAGYKTSLTLVRVGGVVW